MSPFCIFVSFTLIALLEPSYSVPDCGYSDATNTTYVCDCNGDVKCKDALITCPNNSACRVECSGFKACLNAIIQWPEAPGSGTLICAGFKSHACKNVNFPIPNPYEDLHVVCDRSSECEYADIYCPEFANCHIKCNAPKSCFYTQFHWSPNDVHSVLECTYTPDEKECLGANMPPSRAPTSSPTHAPTIPTIDPTLAPSMAPTAFTISPSADPTASPSPNPTVDPTFDPSTTPTVYPSTDPTAQPTVNPTFIPTAVMVASSAINHELIITILSTVIVVLCICCCLLFVAVSVGTKKIALMVNPRNENSGVQSDTDTYINQTENVQISRENAVEPGAAVNNCNEKVAGNAHPEAPNTDLEGLVQFKRVVSSVESDHHTAASHAVTPRAIQMIDIASYERQKSVRLVKQTQINAFEVQQWLENVVKLPHVFDLFISNGYESMQFIKDISDSEELKEIGISCTEDQVTILKAIEKWKNDQK